MASNNSYRLITGLLLLFFAVNANAQTFAEWFKQKSTQKKYLLQQIEALQVYTGYLRKGYTVAKGGLGSITNELLRENGLHQTYYNKLDKVDPLVANNAQVREIISWQQDIVKLFSSLDGLTMLRAAERNYLFTVRGSVFKDCEGLLSTLQQVLSNNKMQMSDADRVKLINQLNSEMQDNLNFTAAFTGQAKTYAAQRQQEIKNIRSLKQAYGLDQ